MYKYPLPSFLQGVQTQAAYNYWVSTKAKHLRDNDIAGKRPFAAIPTHEEYDEEVNRAAVACNVKLKRPYALNSSRSTYTHMMNDAAQHGRFDPYTGEELAWEEINTWNPRLASNNLEYFKKFRLLPSIDHIDPAADVLQFEICSWKINLCKGNLSPQEFVDLCRRVVEYKKV